MEPVDPSAAARHAVFPKEADTLTACDRPFLDEAVPATQDETTPLASDAEDATSPTVSLHSGDSRIREVYRLFLDSEHAPALELAEALLASGETDPLLVAIAGECRGALESQRPPRIDGKTTIEEVALLARTPVDEVIRLLDRLVALGTGSERPSR